MCINKDKAGDIITELIQKNEAKKAQENFNPCCEIPMVNPTEQQIDRFASWFFGEKSKDINVDEEEIKLIIDRMVLNPYCPSNQAKFVELTNTESLYVGSEITEILSSLSSSDRRVIDRYIYSTLTDAEKLMAGEF